MMRRDTFHDYLTHEDACNAGGASACDWLMRKVISALWRRSGGTNVSGARLTVVEDHSLMALKMRISFDSRSWTGR